LHPSAPRFPSFPALSKWRKSLNVYLVVYLFAELCSTICCSVECAEFSPRINIFPVTFFKASGLVASHSFSPRFP